MLRDEDSVLSEAESKVLDALLDMLDVVPETDVAEKLLSLGALETPGELLEIVEGRLDVTEGSLKIVDRPPEKVLE